MNIPENHLPIRFDYDPNNLTFNIENYMYNNCIVPMELWRPVTQEMVPGVLPIYWISNLGNFYHADTGNFSRRTTEENKYIIYAMKLYDGSIVQMRSHILVCMAFNGMPPNDGIKYQVDHINSIRNCNYEGNLEFVTPMENVHRAMNRETLDMSHYESIPLYMVEEVCSMLEQKVPTHDICFIMANKAKPNIYDFRGLITHLLNGRVFQDIASKYSFARYNTIKFTNEEVDLICQCLEKNMRYGDIMKLLGVSYNTKYERSLFTDAIRKIKNGTTHPNISSKYNMVNNTSYTLTDPELEWVCLRIALGHRPFHILNDMGERGLQKSVRKSVYAINQGICYKRYVDKYKAQLAEGSTTIEVPPYSSICED